MRSSCIPPGPLALRGPLDDVPRGAIGRVILHLEEVFSAAFGLGITLYAGDRGPSSRLLIVEPPALCGRTAIHVGHS
jgi:hypothetical protein